MDGEVTDDERLRAMHARLHVLDAIAMAIDHGAEFFAIVMASPSADAARIRLQEEWGLDDIQAAAALDLQGRRFAAEERERIHLERTEMQRELAELGGAL